MSSAAVRTTVFVCAGGVGGQVTLPRSWTDRGATGAVAAVVGRGVERCSVRRHARSRGG